MESRGAIRGAIAGLWIGLGAALLGWTAPASLATETATQSAAILTVDGNIAGAKPAPFDLSQLKALPAVTVTTTTPWSEGENKFEGVRVRDLLDRLGAKGTTVIAAAVDDYQSTIPIEDIRDYDVIIAYAMNGKPLPVDDKGPLWIIYPFSGHSGLQKDLFYARSVWQLKRLTVK
jgi:hypothetical protein